MAFALSFLFPFLQVALLGLLEMGARITTCSNGNSSSSSSGSIGGSSGGGAAAAAAAAAAVVVAATAVDNSHILNFTSPGAACRF